MEPETEKQMLESPAVRWLNEEYLPSVGMNMSAAARELGISHKTLGLLSRGAYKGDIAGQLAKLEEQRQRLAARGVWKSDPAKIEYVPTDVARRIHAACDAAKITHMVNFVSGRGQIGKTNAARSYARRYPETTILVEVPSHCTAGSLTYELLDACGLPVPNSVSARVHALRKHLTPRHLLILDEAHEGMKTPEGLEALAVVRQLFNRCGCGVVLLVTDTEARDIVRGKFALELEQLTRRGEWEILPPNPAAADVRLIWEAYGFPEPDDATKRVVLAFSKSSCFGELVRRFRQALHVAAYEKRPVAWQDFMDAVSRMNARPA